MSSDITIVLPFYNNEKYIERAVTSVFKQIYTNWRLILIDDATTDNSVNKIIKYTEDPRVTLIRNKKNIGISNCLNLALKQTTTPLLLQLDSDDFLYPHTLEVIVNESKQHPSNVGVFTGNTMINFEDYNGTRILTRVHKGKGFNDRLELILSNHIFMPRCYRTYALQNVGGWPTDDPYEGRYQEDKRIIYKLIDSYSIHCIDQMLYNHTRHEFNVTNSPKVYNEVFEWIIRNAVKGWYPGREFLFYKNSKGYKKIKGIV